jgi:bacterioferritin B
MQPSRTYAARVTAVARFPAELNEQIGREFGASQQYVAIAVYYDSETLPQLAAHFYRQAVEERNHAMMIVQYLLDSDEEVAVPGVEAPRTGFTNPIAPVELALDQEKQVTAQIVELSKLAREEGDLVGEQFLNWFLEEQREEVSSMSDLLSVVSRAGDANILLVEEYLARTGGDSEDGPEATAPPAAGGVL